MYMRDTAGNFVPYIHESNSVVDPRIILQIVNKSCLIFAGQYLLKKFLPELQPIVLKHSKLIFAAQYVCKNILDYQISPNSLDSPRKIVFQQLPNLFHILPQVRVVTEIQCKLEINELEDGALCAADWDEVVGLDVHMIDFYLQEFQQPLGHLTQVIQYIACIWPLEIVSNSKPFLLSGGSKLRLFLVVFSPLHNNRKPLLVLIDPTVLSMEGRIVILRDPFNFVMPNHACELFPVGSEPIGEQIVVLYQCVEYSLMILPENWHFLPLNLEELVIQVVGFAKCLYLRLSPLLAGDLQLRKSALFSLRLQGAFIEIVQHLLAILSWLDFYQMLLGARLYHDLLSLAHLGLSVHLDWRF